MVIHGNRLEDLRDLVVNVIKTYQLPVLNPEIFLVQNNGMKHWLELALANDQALGICAATQIELPSSYLWGIYRSVLSDIEIPVHMPFDKKRLTWRLYKLLPSLIEDDSFKPLKKYLSASSDSRRLYQLASQIADVFDGYQNYRADWLRDWSLGSDCLIGDSYLKDPVKPLKLDADEVWQSKLWRALREDIGPDLAEASRASVHAQFITKMDSVIEEFKKTKQTPKGIPKRIIVFGISSLPPQIIEAFAKLGNLCQVFMFVQNPCQFYWGDIIDGNEMLRTIERRRQRASPNSGPDSNDLHLITHPLLASWGKQGRDYFHLLDDFDSVSSYKNLFQKVDVFEDPVEPENPNPLQLPYIQSCILNLTPEPEEEYKLTKSENDQSLQFVSSHSAQREVEILHDQLHFWFDQDPELKAEDVMVMVPDMEVFLPHIKAVFARYSNADVRFIPFSIADTTPKESPIVRALSQLLSIPSLKISVLDWLSLFEVDAVCKRFEISSSEVVQLKEWIVGSGIRWGLNNEHRVRHGMDLGFENLDQNTWDFGLRRLLLGYAIEDQQSWHSTLAYTGVGGLDGPLVGKLLTWLDAIKKINDSMSEHHRAGEWVKIFKDVIELFFLACDEAQERLMDNIFEPIEQWERICTECNLDDPVELHVVRDYWLAELEQIGLQQRFFGGGVQFGTLMPMRSIPFSIICLLGMNDGEFPRQTTLRDFDLMSKHRRTGDRSRREDDRYLFLEALLCARKKLYVSWQGFSARDNSVRPPSVLVAQLLDYVNALWNVKTEPVNHPLQPFSLRYFSSDSSLFTYDKNWEQILARPVGESASQVSTEVSGSEVYRFEKLSSTDLYRLLRHPVEVFFRSRLNISIEKLEEDAIETEPFSLNSLEEFKIADQLLKASSLEEGLNQIRLSGQLPMQGYGEIFVHKFKKKVQDVISKRDHWIDQFPNISPSTHLSIKLGETNLSTTLLNLRSRIIKGTDKHEFLQVSERVGAVSEKLNDLTYARADVVALLWVNHLIACATGLQLTSVQIGSDTQVVLDSLPPFKAQDILQRFITVYGQAWHRPLPLACKTAWVWLQSELFNQKIASGEIDKELEDSHENAEKIFEPSFTKQGERRESIYLSRAFEGYDDLRSELPLLSKDLYLDMAIAARILQPIGGGV